MLSKDNKRKFDKISDGNHDNKHQEMWKELNNVGDVDELIWVSPTSIKNYMMNDPIIDWIKKKHETKFNINNNIALQYLFKCGNEFEKLIFEYLHKTYKNNVIEMEEHQQVTEENVKKTINYMKKGIPIILHGHLKNEKNKTHGIPDILIRSDWIQKIFDEEENIDCIKTENLLWNCHYRVIEIKWSTLNLCANGKTIRNSDLFPAHKGQLTIYNSALGQVQGYYPPKSYILGRSWKQTNGDLIMKINKDLLGHVDFLNFDNKYLEQTKKAIIWINYVNKNWKTLTYKSCPEMYPNMNNHYDGKYHLEKQQISDEIGEMTNLWMVGVKNREFAIRKNILSINDKRCNSKNMNMKGKTGMVVDKIIKINNMKRTKILPKIIKNNDGYWKQKKGLDIYIDFETITTVLYDEVTLNETNQTKKSEGQTVFLIGLGFMKEGKWKYKKFLSKKFGDEKIFHKFYKYIKKLMKKITKNIKLFHWGNIEKTLLDKYIKRNDKWSKLHENLNYIDMCKVFTDEPICIKGAKKFGLKEITKAMNINKMINTNWNDCVIKDGMTAMIQAINYYKSLNKDKKIIKEIVKYNNVDCKTVYEIVNYLKNKNI